MKNITTHKSGITLLETILAVLIISIMTISLTRFFKNQSRSTLHNQARLTYQTDVERFFDDFTWEFLQAKKDSVAITDLTQSGADVLRGHAISFEYQHPITDDHMECTYTFSDHAIRCIRQNHTTNDPPKKITVIRKITATAEDLNLGPFVFFKQNNEPEYIQTVSILIRPFERPPIPNTGDQLVMSTVVTARN
ncbi:MAG: hypothetical protein GF384_02665 [Elusimicrobia bacterium]|nr:hypothetical protein [Elusimicrobiota bacterium]MBD3411860.1 hypothetical protein [Elusimicrobiota bacterium]